MITIVPMTESNREVKDWEETLETSSLEKVRSGVSLFTQLPRRAVLGNSEGIERVGASSPGSFYT
jgi:hypothetical protein